LPSGIKARFLNGNYKDARVFSHLNIEVISPWPFVFPSSLMV
jgi:hypothetical protein